MHIPMRLIPPHIPKEKLIVAYTNKDGRRSVVSHTFDTQKEMVQIRYDRFGQFEFAQDTVPPLITPVNISEGKWLTREKYIKCIIGDNLSGIQKIEAAIDSQWVRVWYEPKRRLIQYDFKDLLLKGNRHHFSLKVTDGKKNETQYAVHFFRKGK